MVIFGMSLVGLLGIVNFILLTVQLLSGLRVIKISMSIHKKTGIMLYISAFLHGLLAFVSHL